MKNTLDIELENVTLKRKIELLEDIMSIYEQKEKIYKDIINNLCNRLGVDSLVT